MALDVMSMLAKLGLDKTEYEEGMKDAESGFKNFGSKLKSGVQNVAKVAAGAAAAGAAAFGAVTAAVVKGTGEVASFGDNIDKASQKLGISAKAYQEWDAVLQHSGTSIDSMSIGMKTLSTKAAEGSDAFKKLGIKQKEAAKMSREDLFNQTITALQNVKDANQRAQLAQELFGKSAMELGPLLNTTAEDTQAMKDRVNELGGVMSDEAVKASAAYQDSLQDMTTAMDGMKRNLFASFLPSFTAVMDGITEIFAGGSGVKKIREGVQSLLKNISTELPKMLKKGLKIAEAVGGAVVSVVPEMARKVVTAGQKLFSTLKNRLMTQGVQSLARLLNELITGGADKSFGPAQIKIQATLTKLFGSVISIGQTIFEKFTEAWNTVLKPVFEDIAAFVVNDILPAVTTIMQKLEPFFSWISEAVSTLFQVISNYWSGFLMPVLRDILHFVVDKVIVPLIDWFNEKILPVIKTVFETAVTLWAEKLQPALSEIWSYITETLGPAIIKVWQEDVMPVIETVFTAIAGFWTDTLKPAFEAIYDYVVVTLIPELIVWWEYKLKPTIESVFVAIAGFWNDTLRPAFEAIWRYVTVVLIPALQEKWEAIQPVIQKVFEAIAGFWNDTLRPAFEAIWRYVTVVLIPTLKEKWESIQPVIETVFTAIKTFWEETAQPALQDFAAFVTDTVLPAVSSIGDKVKYIWDIYLRPIALWLGETFVKAWEGVSTFATETLIPAISNIGDKVKYVWDTFLRPVALWVTTTFVKAWEGLQDAIQLVADFLSGDFSVNWQGIWENLVQLIKTPFDTLKDILKEPLNAVIDLVNSVISKVESGINTIIAGINSALTIHKDPEYDFLTGKVVPGSGYDISPNIQPIQWGRIDRLARGGIVGNGGRAIVGEYAPEFLQVVGGKAVVTPMNTGRFPGGSAQEIVVPRNQSRDITIILELDRQQMAKAVYKMNCEETQRVGLRLSKGGAY